jgi:hypothetical protein
MLAPPWDEMGSVISRFLRLMAFACCALVVLSFAMFARDQMAGASARQETALVAGTSTTPSARDSSKPHAQPRRFIDSTAKVLRTPFDAIVQSSNLWVKEGLPAAFALIVYGLGLGYLARYTSVRS